MTIIGYSKDINCEQGTYCLQIRIKSMNSFSYHQMITYTCYYLDNIYNNIQFFSFIQSYCLYVHNKDIFICRKYPTVLIKDDKHFKFVNERFLIYIAGQILLWDKDTNSLSFHTSFIFIVFWRDDTSHAGPHFLTVTILLWDNFFRSRAIII